MSFKKLSVVLITLGTAGLCSAAYAGQCPAAGFYVGGQAGYGKADYGNFNTGSAIIPGVGVFTTTKTEDGVAGRAYVGYQFNPYVGLETGYSLYSQNKYNARFSGTNLSGAPASATVNFKVDTQVADLLAKVGMPFGNSGFSGNIKGGVAYVMSKPSVSVSASNIGVASASGSTQDNWDPAAGASVAYHFNQNFAMDVAYLHTFGKGQFNNSNPNLDLLTLGVSYTFA